MCIAHMGEKKSFSILYPKITIFYKHLIEKYPPMLSKVNLQMNTTREND